MQGAQEGAPEPQGGGETGTPPQDRDCLVCESLLGIHQAPPSALPKEIELLLWYHQLCRLGVLDDEEYTWKKRQLLATPSDLTASPPSSDEPAKKSEGSS